MVHRFYRISGMVIYVVYGFYGILRMVMRVFVGSRVVI